MKLTKSKVEGFPVPIDGQALYWDDELRGFGVRVTPSGARSYIAQGRVSGKTRRVTLGAHGKLTCDEARKRARAALVALDDGVDPQIEKKRNEALSVTLREVAAEYCRERRTNKGGELKASSKNDIHKHVNKNFADWADKPIVNITRDLCSTRFSEMSIRGPAQANQAFRVLRALINYACEAYRPGDTPLILENPVSVISGKRMWNPNKARDTRIPLESVGTVWNLLQDRRTSPAVLPIGQTGADIIIFIMLTGCRWSEAAELTWDCVNLEAGSWHIPDPKNHNPVTFPLSAPARAMLSARPRVEGNHYVFPSRGRIGCIQDARNTMAEVSKVAGVRLSPHDLRRTFIAIGIKVKIEMWKLKLLTNHIAKGDVTLDHYTETNDLRYLSGEAEQIAAWIVEQGKIAAGANVVQLRGVTA
ncbi:MAG: integrase family protein [Nitrosomonas sp.]|uniref:tyrosine-type recombinase/integrase n=1 Tax=Nitrosomonas sp. TaxID=42353 RepID=UPI00272FADA4|nr:integrase family protein [Nitrosomonas sp.]MDP1550508.1 integrase family protein [Nitrosomonas sp.]